MNGTKNYFGECFLDTLRSSENKNILSFLGESPLKHVANNFTWNNNLTKFPFYLSGTQRVISFLRQMVEHGGFYRTSDQAFVKLERIQFVGACNPPTDPGRKPLSHRFVFKKVTFLFFMQGIIIVKCIQMCK